MPNHYDIEDIEVKEETEEQIRLRKITRAIIGAVLVFLMLSFIIPSDVIQSNIQSETVKNYAVTFNGKTILFESGVFEQIQNYYLTHQLTEFKICLQGNITKDANQSTVYKITSFYSPTAVWKTPVSIAAESCRDSLIEIHSHPFRNCLFSEQDMSTYKNKNMIYGVMCDINRFTFYEVSAS